MELRTHRMAKPPTWTRIPEELRRRGFAPLHLPDDDADLDRYAIAVSAAVARVGRTDSYVENGRRGTRPGARGVALPSGLTSTVNTIRPCSNVAASTCTGR